MTEAGVNLLPQIPKTRGNDIIVSYGIGQVTHSLSKSVHGFNLFWQNGGIIKYHISFHNFSY
jgi:hypothetical protein